MDEITLSLILFWFGSVILFHLLNNKLNQINIRLEYLKDDIDQLRLMIKKE